MKTSSTDPKTKKNLTILDGCLLTALEQIESGILAVNKVGEVIAFNRAAEAITGFSRSEVLGCHYLDLPCREDSENGDLLSRILQGENVSEQKTERFLGCKDGGKVPVEAVVRPVKDKRDKIVGAVEIFTDLSTIRLLKDEVSRSRTLSALGEMAANVAHEIRNPLGSIGGFATLLERDLDDDDPRRNLVKKIIEGVASLDKIVTNLLIYTRPLAADLRWTNLIEYVNEVLAFIEVDIESQSLPISLKRDFPLYPLGARIDPSLMQQVLLNIFQNAIYAMKGCGGVLTIRLSRTKDCTPHKKVNGFSQEHVELTVEDQGVGMSEEVQKKIFNPFFTTREDGTGLGLAISKKMIQEQNGSIAVSSQLDVGTKIIIRIPYYP